MFSPRDLFLIAFPAVGFAIIVQIKHRRALVRPSGPGSTTKLIFAQNLGSNINVWWTAVSKVDSDTSGRFIPL